MEELRDIKPLVQIPDSSFIVFIGLVLFGLFILVVILFFSLRWIKRRKANPKRVAFKKLKVFEFKDAKKDAYLISKYAFVLADTKDKKIAYDTLVKSLEKYKYKKDVPFFCEEDKEALKKYLEVCNV